MPHFQECKKRLIQSWEVFSIFAALFYTAPNQRGTLEFSWNKFFSKLFLIFPGLQTCVYDKLSCSQSLPLAHLVNHLFELPHIKKHVLI